MGDTADEKGEVLPEKQSVVLELRGNGHLRTAERIVVAHLREEDLQHIAEERDARNRTGALIRCEVDSVDIAARCLRGTKAVRHVAARSRVWADSWGRIVFQHLHRDGKADCISFDSVLS